MLDCINFKFSNLFFGVVMTDAAKKLRLTEMAKCGG